MTTDTTPIAPTNQVNNQAYEITKGWSWAGSFFTMGVFVASRRWLFFVCYMVTMAIPLVNMGALIIWMIYGGLRGKVILYDARNFINHDEKVGAIKALEMVGFVFFILMLVGIIASFLFSAAIAALFSGLF